MGDSERRQIENAAKYAATNGLELAEMTFKDLGLSAYTGRNLQEGALGAFIRKLDEGTIERGCFLLVEELDRLSREKPTKAFGLLTSIVDRGVTVVTVSDGRAYSSTILNQDFSALLLALSKGYVAHEESAKKGMRLRAAWDKKRADARANGGVFMSKLPAWISFDKAAKKFNLIEDRAEVIRLIYSLAAEGHGATYITRHLNGLGIPPFGRSKHGWGLSYVKKILASETVIGTYQPYKLIPKDARDDGKARKPREIEGAPIPNYYPNAVPFELFYRVAGMQNAKPKPKGRRGKFVSNLFTGLAVCGECGATMGYENKGPGTKGGCYLTCTANLHGSKRHPRLSIRYLEAQTAILISLQEINYDDLFPAIQAARKERIQEVDIALGPVRHELETAKKQADQLLTLLLENPESPTMKERLVRTEARISELVPKVERLEKERGRRVAESSRAEDDPGALSNSMKRFFDLSSKDPSGELFNVRTKMAHLLKETIERITFRLPKSAEEQGRIEIRFQTGDEFSREIVINRKYNGAMSYQIESGQEPEPCIAIDTLEWPPTGRFIFGSALWNEFIK